MRIFLLLLISFCSFGQKNPVITFDWWSYDNIQTDSIPMEYVPLPIAPDIGDNPTIDINISMGSSITTAEMDGNFWGLLPSSYANRFRANGLIGTKSIPYVFRPKSDIDYAIIDGTSLSNGDITGYGSNASNWVQFHKMLVLGNTGISTQTGFKWLGLAGKSNVLASDMIFMDTQSPTIQFNGDGDAGTYGRMTMMFLRGSGSITDNEWAYFGDTSTSGFGIIDSLTVKHIFATRKGWDGLQINSADSVGVYNVTVYYVGSDSTSGQKNLLQAQNIGDNAVFNNNLFWGAPQAFTVAGRSVTFNNCIFYSSEEGFYQDVVLDAGYSEPDVLSSIGGTVTFNNCRFYSRIARNSAVLVQENNANFIFNNCVKDNLITQLVDDNRIDKITYSITEINTTSKPTPLPPVFNSLDFTNPEAGLITSTFFYNLGAGYRFLPQ